MRTGTRPSTATHHDSPSPTGYQSGFCDTRYHDRCRGVFGTVECCCACHRPGEDPPEPVAAAPQQPRLTVADRLSRAAALVDHEGPMPPGTGPSLAQLLRSEAAWSTGRDDTYPDDRAPLLRLADLILGGAR